MSAAAAKQIVPQPLPQKLIRLEKEQRELMRKVAAAERELTRLGEHARQAATEVVSRVAPMLDELHALAHQVHELMQELLRPKRLPPNQRRKVVMIYRELIESGQIPPLPGGAPEEAEEPEEHAPSAPRAAASATAMKDVYRRLAGALHPDRAENEAERALRTEWMKEVTVAYGQGDLARLLELERVRGARPSTSAEDLERRCATLARTNEELRAQLAGLRLSVKEARRSPEVQLARGRTRSQKRNEQDPIDEYVEDTQADLQDLRAARDFIRDFRDGKITYKQFLAGPGADEEFVLPPGIQISMSIDMGVIDLGVRLGVRGGSTRPRSRTKKRR